jgi:hypothetical protein
MRWQVNSSFIVALIVTVCALSYVRLSIAQEVPKAPEEVLDSPKIFHHPGSYQLKGNIIAAHEGPAIQIAAPDVTLDLNGYTISSTLSSGIGIDAPDRNVTIRNGAVRGFDAGIVAGPNCRIRNVRVTESGTGVNVMDSCLVLDNTITDNWGPGLITMFAPEFPMSPGLGIPAFGNNLINNNNGGNENPQVVGAWIEIGTNVCGNTTFCANSTTIISPASILPEKHKNRE